MTDRTRRFSPSEQYELTIESRPTTPGCWNPKGPLLVCGADYQGQTVIELATGARRDFVPKAASSSASFSTAGAATASRASACGYA